MNVRVGAVKRPRISSLPDNINIASPATTDLPLRSPSTTLGETPPTHTDLLPPVKRSAKRQKRGELPGTPQTSSTTPSINTDDPLNPMPSGTVKSTRRNPTNSYWSVAEKDRFRELVLVHGTNVRVIAGIMGGKTERQVANFYEAHREDMGLDELAKNAPEGVHESDEMRVCLSLSHRRM
jgi:serine/arginine repetitive matrix protein 2